MFYLKYRPKTISSLDNSVVRETISNLLSSKTIPHALLFIGSKGMGKTSTARIFAKSVNCLDNMFAKKGTSFEPCNACINCLSIDSGSSPDVVEQDAASNRGIDEVKRLIREASFSPMTGRYRVYIIDEAHMITNDGFNALLKTLEEPPETVIFILATTNEEKVPATILSRCVRVGFGKALKQDVISMLNRIEKEEGITVSQEVNELIASSCEDSFRDATKILEELVVQKMLDIEKAQQYLGVRSVGALLKLLEESDSLGTCMQWIESYKSQGGDIKKCIEDTLRALHSQLLSQTDKSNKIALDYTFSLKETSLLIKFLHQAYQNLKITPIDTLVLEIAVAEFYNARTT